MKGVTLGRPGESWPRLSRGKFGVRLFVVEKMIKDVMVLDLRGQITLGKETEVLREKIKHLVESGHSRIILNLGEVTYIDSVGLSTLVSSYTSARKQGGDLKLLHLTKRVRDVLQITRLITIFECYNTLEDARHSFQPISSP